jgi:hypothetical protein
MVRFLLATRARRAILAAGNELAAWIARFIWAQPWDKPGGLSRFFLAGRRRKRQSVSAPVRRAPYFAGLAAGAGGLLSKSPALMTVNFPGSMWRRMAAAVSSDVSAAIFFSSSSSQ